MTNKEGAAVNGASNQLSTSGYQVGARSASIAPPSFVQLGRLLRCICTGYGSVPCNCRTWMGCSVCGRPFCARCFRKHAHACRAAAQAVRP
jgi:hypothetical protein